MKSSIKIVLWINFIILLLLSISSFLTGYGLSYALDQMSKNDEIGISPMLIEVLKEKLKTMKTSSYILGVVFLAIAFSTYYFGIRKL